jgi:hypothetical protein
MAKGAPPASFTILKSLDASMGIDGNFWMHFTVATQDIGAIIISGQYTNNPRPTSLSGMYPPEWWNEEKFRDGMKCYERQRHHETFRDCVEEEWVLWINEETGDGYFAWASF